MGYYCQRLTFVMTVPAWHTMRTGGGSFFTIMENDLMQLHQIKSIHQLITYPPYIDDPDSRVILKILS